MHIKVQQYAKQSLCFHWRHCVLLVSCISDNYANILLFGGLFATFIQAALQLSDLVGYR